MKKRVAYFATHPVQYAAPIYRQLAKSEDVALKVYYFSDHGVSSSFDPGFGQEFAWDQDLLSGYESEFIGRNSLSNYRNFEITEFTKWFSSHSFDFAILSDYRSRFAKQLTRNAKRLKSDRPSISFAGVARGALFGRFKIIFSECVG